MNRFLTSAIAAALAAMPHGSDPAPSRGTLRPETLTRGAEASIRRVGALRSARSAQTATAIAGDRVLITGGMQEGGAALRSYELFDARTNRIVAVGEM